MAPSPSETDPPHNHALARTAVVTTRLRPEDLARLDLAAERRGIDREHMLAEAIDAFLAREMWSGGFIAPPPPMEVPGPSPWRSGAFRRQRRK